LPRVEANRFKSRDDGPLSFNAFLSSRDGDGPCPDGLRSSVSCSSLLEVRPPSASGIFGLSFFTPLVAKRPLRIELNG
jgi:hypothetical protein